MDEEKTTGRIEAFSDGVFAVAITLLALDIKVPPPNDAHAGLSLTQKLLHQWPTYLAFLTSFLTILIMWINHHRVFSLIQRTDNRFMIYNGLLLLCVTVFPFSTSLLTAYMRHHDANTAATVYAGTCLAMATCFNLVWRYASTGGRLLTPDHNSRLADGITRAYRFGPLLYLIVFMLAFFSMTASMSLCILLAVFFTLPPVKHKVSK